MAKSGKNKQPPSTIGLNLRSWGIIALLLVIFGIGLFLSGYAGNNTQGIASNQDRVVASSWMPRLKERYNNVRATAPNQVSCARASRLKDCYNRTLGQYSWYVSCGGTVIGIVVLALFYYCIKSNYLPSFFSKKNVSKSKKDFSKQKTALANQFVRIDCFTSLQIKDINRQYLVHKELSLTEVNQAIESAWKKRSGGGTYLGFRIKKKEQEIFPTKKVKEELQRGFNKIRTRIIEGAWNKILHKHGKKAVKDFNFVALTEDNVDYIKWRGKQRRKRKYDVGSDRKGYVKGWGSEFFIAPDPNRKNKGMFYKSWWLRILQYMNQGNQYEKLIHQMPYTTYFDTFLAYGSS